MRGGWEMMRDGWGDAGAGGQGVGPGPGSVAGPVLEEANGKAAEAAAVWTRL